MSPSIFFRAEPLSPRTHLNLKLSYKRAENVKNYLLLNNITNKIIIEGYGEIQTLINTKDGVEEKQNRRTEVILK